jgi:hypothetical protein
MSLLDLPAEFLREISMHAGEVRSLWHGLNTTVGQSWVYTHYAYEDKSAKVPGFVTSDFILALYGPDGLNIYLEPMGLVQYGSLGHAVFWQNCVAHKIYMQQKPLSRREQVVHDAAKGFLEMGNDHNWELLRRYVHALCY